MLKINIENFDTLDSTNDQAMYQIEHKHIKKEKIIIARQQTNGHGANGHKFISDRDVGIYFTYIHFYKNTKELSFITQKAAVAIYKTFQEIFNIELNIKWINDLYFKNKKIAGILCRNLIKYKSVIVGIGIDLFYNCLIDDSIKDIAGYIFKDSNDLIDTLKKNKLINENSSTYKNIINDFNIVRSSNILRNKWLANSLVYEIVKNLISYINIEGLPSLYIEKNIIKDDKIYEDCVLEC